MNISRYLVATFVVAAAVFVLQTEDTYACPVAPTPTPTPTPCPGECPGTIPVKDGVNWTSLDMRQSQWIEGNQTNVVMKQNGVGHTATFLGDHAMSSSKHFGNQNLVGGAPTKAEQHQRIVSGARTEFQANKVPSWTTAGTMGRVINNQNAWSAHPLNLKQVAGTEQVSQVGETKSVVQGQEQQTIRGATGDPIQRQDLRGSSQAQGFSSLPFPQVHTLGTTFRQIVNFNVDNIFSF